jgi:hypothetical protein
VDFSGKAQHSLAALLQIIVTAFMPVCRAFRSKMGARMRGRDRPIACLLLDDVHFA